MSIPTPHRAAPHVALAAAVLMSGLLVAPLRAQDDGGAGTPPSAPEVAPAPEAGTFRERREAAAALAGDDAVLLVLASGGAAGFTGRVRSDDFFYVCPFHADDGAVLLDRDGEGRVRHRVYVQPRRAFVERWNGVTVGPGDGTAQRFAFDEARPIDALVADLAASLAERRTLLVSAAAPADGSERLERILERLSSALPEGVTIVRRDRRPPRRAAPGAATAKDAKDGEDAENGKSGQATSDAVVVKPGGGVLAALRGVKTPAEVARVQRAIDATVVGLRDAARCLRPGLAEYQIQAVIEFRCRAAGCERQAFDSIVGSGPNSCVLHYKANRRTMRDGDVVVCDVGGEFEGYAADVTRTFPVSGTFTARQAEIYDAVLAAQKAGIAAVRPGVTLRDVHVAAKAVLRERGLDRWFFHGTSHSVGLNVHDVWPGRRKLEPGSILTVEPGVYIAEEEIGVRIEDTVLVTEDGALVLSRGVPKERAEVEALMAEKATLDLAPPADDGAEGGR